MALIRTRVARARVVVQAWAVQGVRVMIRRERHPAQQVDVALIWARVARARVIVQAWAA